MNIIIFLKKVKNINKYFFKKSNEIKRNAAADKEGRLNSYARKKNGFVTATKLRTTNKFFVAATKNFAAATKRFVDRTNHFVVVTKYFCYPYFNK